jgi:hypothetical protein
MWKAGVGRDEAGTRDILRFGCRRQCANSGHKGQGRGGRIWSGKQESEGGREKGEGRRRKGRGGDRRGGKEARDKI